MEKRLLILENGQVFEGQALGAAMDVTGELVFHTGMTGYQESISSQSYNGQILTFTYPLVGNAGIRREDYESISPTCKGVVVADWARRPSNWRSQMNLDEFLRAKKIPGISGIDTRALSRIIREQGSMKATLANPADELKHLQDQLKATVLPTDNVKQVSTKTAYPVPGSGRSIVVVDFGLKHSILRELVKRNCNVTVVPYDTRAKEILQLYPDGVLLSNGPGNPDHLPQVLEMIRGIQGKVPIFAIGLGHQLLAKANGARTYKMKVSHRGFNHAVREIATGRVDFVSQNHAYAIKREDFPSELLMTHEGVGDGVIEGIRHRHYPAFSVQFQPEAGPGPYDVSCLFDEFMDLMDSFWDSQRRN